MKIADIVSSCIKISIESSERSKYKMSAKKSDMNFEFTDFQRKLDNLRRRSMDTEHDIDELKRVYLTAAKIDKGTIKLIEEKLGILTKALDELTEAQKLYIQIKTKFGSNRVASKLVQESKNVVNQLDSVYSKAKSIIEGIASKKSPSVLSEKNKVVEQLIDIIQEEMDSINESGKVTGKSRFEDDSYSVSSTPKGLKFAMYMDLRNFPKIDKKTLKTIYAVITSDLDIPKTKGKRIVGDFSDVYLTLTPIKVSPDKLPVSYKIRSAKEIRNVLSYLAYENNLNAFNNIATKASKTRLDSLSTSGKIRLLNKEGVKFTSKDNKIKVTIPQELLEKEGVLDDTKFADLYVDVQRLAGLPQTGPKARYTSGRIKYTQKKHGKNYIYIFTVFPMSPTFDMEENVSDKKYLTDKDADEVVKEMFKDESDLDYLLKDIKSIK